MPQFKMPGFDLHCPFLYHANLVLIRHGESTWNLENRFTGWTDVDLTPTGVEQAMSAGKPAQGRRLDFDLCCTSVLKRAIHTLHCLTRWTAPGCPCVKTGA